MDTDGAWRSTREGRLSWSAGLRLIVSIEPLADGGTRVVQSEKSNGVLAWLAAGLAKDIAAGFDAMNLALRDRVAQRDQGKV